MAGSPLETALRHDRGVVLAAIVAVTALAWAYLFHLAAMDGMAGMEMPAMPGMMAPAVEPWGARDFVFMFLMWAVMMVGMMLPSAAPMVLIYGSVARHALKTGTRLAATGWFASGYLLAWTAFAAAATLAQWALEQAALLSPMTMATEARLGGAVLIVAGLYQWTPLKHACLSKCQAPLMFIQQHGGFRRDAAGSLWLGFRHGLYCVGCCWALMAILFAVGVMNMLWIAGLAAFVLAEKLLPVGWAFSRAAGTALVAVGLWMLV
jgi:predicted metal-binding membrane protein